MEYNCRTRRYYLDKDYEIWSCEFDFGEGFSAQDKVIIQWNSGNINVLLLTISKERTTSDEFLSVILALFEDLTDGEGSFRLKRIYDTDVEEYDISDLKEKIISIYS